MEHDAVRARDGYHDVSTFSWGDRRYAEAMVIGGVV